MVATRARAHDGDGTDTRIADAVIFHPNALPEDETDGILGLLCDSYQMGGAGLNDAAGGFEDGVQSSLSGRF